MANKIGLLASFAYRWRDSPAAQSIVPYTRFFTGRIPNPQEYPFPYISIIPGSGRPVYRSDKYQGSRRGISVHIWVDQTELQRGEEIAEVVRIIYAAQAWRYDFGRIIDVLDGGPPNCHQINEPTFQAWEIVKYLSLCIEQPRMDLSICTNIWSTSSGNSNSSVIDSGASSSRESSDQTNNSSGELIRV